MTVIKKSHADASPSSSSIWIQCPASVTKARGRARKATIYTIEGTAAHVAAELAIKGDDVPITLVIDGQPVAVTEEMLDAVDDYVDYVWAAATGSAALLIETRVHVDVDGEDLYGTADAIVVKEPNLEIIDFKYGQGVAVDPDSSQLRIYALGALEEIGPFVDGVDLTIVQPRAGGIKRTHVSVSDLRQWERDTLKPAVAKLAAGDPTEEPGDHCRWCVRAGECEALAQLAMSNAKVAFGDIPPDPSGMSDDELGARLDYGEMILAWVNRMRAEASGRIDNGGYIPGWKLVPKRAMRKWADPLGALQTLMDCGIPSYEVARIETIGNVEKALKRRKLDPEKVIYPFTKKESSGSTLVSEKDGRPAVDTSAKNVFNDLDDPFENLSGSIN